ncbi:MAG: response regulator [Proteobacteria bacterium]|nr:response regulator [Pseudomonadota bacterium]MBU4260039.1 response regulator [Pseudomonadota bacterium]MBU4288878.1 response regulator [Pseudomonadota bacterium]MBU4414740.1 response regulator [Pseudomonadota bacterium]MCG2757206.1 response regulator [Desulfobacteraceae bacterium]
MNEAKKIKILLVDDRHENLLALENIIENSDLDIIKATSGNEALGLMLEYEFALVLLDVQMPEMDGFETADLMRGNERTKQIPIIFVTAISFEQKHVFKGYESGAVDYLFKPFDPYILKSKVKVFIELFKQKKALEITTNDLKKTVEELKKANQKILEQQKSLIDEERLKVLLQMAGATAHELNQPLMGLLGYIDLIKLCKDDPEKLIRHTDKIKESALRIADIVKKIQNLRNYETKPYLGETSIINIE